MLNFGLIGKGYISKNHINTIQKLGHKIVAIYDPFLSHIRNVEDIFNYNLDYVVICSPTNFHYEYIKLCLKNNVKVICEKPIGLPWNPLIDNDNINIVLQYEYANLPNKADLVEVIMVRDKKYFESWKGNSYLTGGIFYHLFIHYIMIAIKTNAIFKGKIISEGKQERKVDDIDLMKLNFEDLYLLMYQDILSGGGIKPKDIQFLMWILDYCNFRYGMGKEVIGKIIYFDPKNVEWNIEKGKI